MEHPAPTPLAQAAEGTPVAELMRLLALDDTRWTYEDLQFSESTQRALIKQEYPVILVARLKQRHTRAARRLLMSETSTDHSRLILAAERILGGVA